LRSCLLRLARALRHVSMAHSLRALADELRPVELLSIAVDELVQLAFGARRRLSSRGALSPPTSGHGVANLGLSIERAVEDDGERTALMLSIETLEDSLRAELPPMFATLIMRILRSLAARPLEAPKVTRTSSSGLGPVEE